MILTKLLIAFSSFLLLISAPLKANNFDADNNSVVSYNVLFPANIGYDTLAKVESDGTYSGYYHELLDKVEDEQNVKFNYITVDNITTYTNVVSDCIINGTNNKLGIKVILHIDRADTNLVNLKKVFNFTYVSDCDSPTYLYTQNSNTTISEFDLSTYEGATVGVVQRDYGTISLFTSYATSNGLYDATDLENSKIKIKYYGTQDELETKFKEKDCDIIVGKGSFNFDEVRTLDLIYVRSTFSAVIKGNEDIFNKLNDGYQSAFNTSYSESLYNKYFPTYYNHIILNDEEKAYVLAKKEVSIGYATSYFPFIYDNNDGELTGVLVDYFNELKEKTGLVFSFIKEESFRAGLIDIKNKELDLWISDLINHKHESYIKTTASYLSDAIYVFANKDFKGSIDSASSVGVLSYNQDQSVSLNYKIYEDPMKMVTDVNSGTTDVCLVSQYYYNYARFVLRLKNIVSLGIFNRNSVAFDINSDDNLLRGIMNKSIRYMTYNETDNLITKHINDYKVNYTTLDWFNDNYTLATLIIFSFIVILICLISVIAIAYYNRKKDNIHLKKISETDYLSGLPNKKAFEKDGNELVTSRTPFFLVMVDIDNFKAINDLYGHVNGDEVLRILSKEAMAINNQFTKFYRFGGDEFIAIIRSNNIANIQRVFENAKVVEDKPIILNGNQLMVTFSIGISHFPDDSLTLDGMITCADNAMYYSKTHGKDLVTSYNKDVLDSMLKDAKIENEIKEAIKDNRIYMLFQPQINLNDFSMDCVESLMRIKDSPYGPAEFIRVAEKSGLIVRLGRIAVEQSIKFLKDVEDETGKVLSCSINLSAMQMSDLTFYDFLKETLTKYNVKPTQIVIEMTESVFFSDNNQLKMLLNNFYKDKIRLALDDFGSGYSSINNLTKYKFTCVKFDKGIIDSMLARGDISNLINLVHSYGYIVLAEGVETAEQLEYLKKEKCDYIQGYYFSKPVSKEEIISKYIDKIK